MEDDAGNLISLASAIMRMVASLVPVLLSALLAPAPGQLPALAVTPVPKLRWAHERVLQNGAGRLVVALGDPTRARHVAVLVPGVGATPATFDEPDRPERRLYGMARAVRALAPDTAVVAWLGYRPPAGLGWDAVTGGRAREGATALHTFLAGLRRTTAPGTSIGLVCHSYGATVCGLAAPDLPVDDLVLLAAPGVRADSAAGLRTRARVWAARAPDDWIRWVPHVRLGDLGHGMDPADPAFGAHPLPVDGVHGHDGYFAPGSSTLRAVAAVVAGRDRPRD